MCSSFCCCPAPRPLQSQVKCLGKMAEKTIAPPKIFTVMMACGGGDRERQRNARSGRPWRRLQSQRLPVRV
eukprot:8507868-Pyramimonas_sp.AAC.1